MVIHGHHDVARIAVHVHDFHAPGAHVARGEHGHRKVSVEHPRRAQLSQLLDWGDVHHEQLFRARFVVGLPSQQHGDDLPQPVRAWNED